MATRRPVNRITPRKRPAGPADATTESATTAPEPASPADPTVRLSTADSDTTVKSAVAEGNAAESAVDPAAGTAQPASSADSTVRPPAADATVKATVAQNDTGVTVRAADQPSGADPTVRLSTAAASGADPTTRLSTAAPDVDSTVRLSTESGAPDPTVRLSTESGIAEPESGVPGANAASGADLSANAQAQSSSGRKSRPAFGSTRTLIALTAAAAVLTAFAVLAAFRPGVPGGNNHAFTDTAATTEVTAAARNALQTVYSYDSKTVTGYKDAVHAVVTGKMRSDFDSFADTTVSAIQQAQSSAKATADPIGVTMLTADHAELLVNLVVSATKDGVQQETASGPIVLRMEKIKGHWLASEIADR